MNKGLLTVDEALEVLLAGARPVAEVEAVPTLEAGGRVLARAQVSTLDVPPMDNSAMDGYAVRSADVPAPDSRLKVAQRIQAGATGRGRRRSARGTAARSGAPAAARAPRAS
jgi:molybdopterin molybdotransferase